MKVVSNLRNETLPSVIDVQPPWGHHPVLEVQVVGCHPSRKVLCASLGRFVS